MDNIMIQIDAYMDDHPEVVLTDDMIRGVILDNIDKLVEEVKEEI